MCSSSAKTPESHLAAEQLLTGGCLKTSEKYKKDIPHSRTKEKPQGDSRRGVYVCVLNHSVMSDSL